MMHISLLMDNIKFHIYKMKTKHIYSNMFKCIGKGTVIFPPLMFRYTEYAKIGENVIIRGGARIELIKKNKNKPELIIGNDVNIEQNVHIICGNKIIIGDKVSITGNVAIVDVEHPYDDISSSIKIGDRVQYDGNYVEIGNGSFIGFGSVILPNVKIGKYAVIGANSVVNVNVPDFSVAAGNPIKIIKIYDHNEEKWIKVK
ncbi:acyltransferase [uncultured Tolumonas sp.]|uniref:acyltransferase n=1 Tax=uncultured Tolumonas sp. TaxID=263765 RepID=UPI002A0A3581|nr:acyltransferase [uncultured Tolumonas sp.]